MKTLIASFATAVALAAGAPAFASDSAAPTVAATPSAPAAKTQRYCFAEVQNGAQVRRNVCATRANWLRRNIDPLRYMGK
ncbi:hypothetical protein [Sphingomonas aracearum]|uniref:Uncharacterized protein n=1 Tax=Sphingomonas aracearum TaxID=2283317 RepID=A0A369VZV7_9SPHN|nr:hypothetical protein [Sphingomonas aracearum]RDE06650.1 hypothetical protein DVW87_02820 [Sphingomonas aracearum]